MNRMPDLSGLRLHQLTGLEIPTPSAVGPQAGTRERGDGPSGSHKSQKSGEGPKLASDVVTDLRNAGSLASDVSLAFLEAPLLKSSAWGNPDDTEAPTALHSFVRFLTDSALNNEGRWLSLAKHDARMYAEEFRDDIEMSQSDSAINDVTNRNKQPACSSVTNASDLFYTDKFDHLINVPGAVKVLRAMFPNVIELLTPPGGCPGPQRISFDEEEDARSKLADEERARNQFVFQSVRVGADVSVDHAPDGYETGFGATMPNVHMLFDTARDLTSSAFGVIASASNASMTTTGKQATSLSTLCEAALRGGDHSVFAHSYDYLLEASPGQGGSRRQIRRCLFYRDLVDYDDSYSAHTSDDLLAAFRRLCVLCAHTVASEFAALNATVATDDGSVEAATDAFNAAAKMPALSVIMHGETKDAQTVVNEILEDTQITMLTFRDFGQGEDMCHMRPTPRDVTKAKSKLDWFRDVTKGLSGRMKSVMLALETDAPHPLAPLCSALVHSCNLSLHLLLSRNCLVSTDGIIHAYPAKTTLKDVEGHMPSSNMHELEEYAIDSGKMPIEIQ